LYKESQIIFYDFKMLTFVLESKRLYNIL